MKNWLCVASLLIALSTLGYSAWLHSSIDARAQAAAVEALHQKELELVDWLKPELLKSYEEMEVQDYSKDPQSLEELCTPMIELIKRL